MGPLRRPVWLLAESKGNDETRIRDLSTFTVFVRRLPKDATEDEVGDAHAEAGPTLAFPLAVGRARCGFPVVDHSRRVDRGSFLVCASPWCTALWLLPRRQLAPLSLPPRAL